MVQKSEDPQSNAPDRSQIVLLLVDVINTLDFEGAEALVEPAVEASDRIAQLKQKAKSAGIPVIYVNDNFGRWRSDLQKLVDRCINEKTPGTPLAEQLAPEPDDYFVLKPKHSAFHATPLEVLLKTLGAKTLIIAGLTVDNCILLTAGDAHMLDYELVIPEDCVVAASVGRKQNALGILRQAFGARTPSFFELDLNKSEL